MYFFIGIYPFLPPIGAGSVVASWSNLRSQCLFFRDLLFDCVLQLLVVSQEAAETSADGWVWGKNVTGRLKISIQGCWSSLLTEDWHVVRIVQLRQVGDGPGVLLWSLA